jgi:beta-N-acetylhexosaminidase
MTVPDRRLAALADAVLLPCFDGTSAPDWIRRRVAGSLGGVCLFARNIADPDTVQAMTSSLAAERDSVVIAIDEEAGDVTRLDAAAGSRFPGAAALGRPDDADLTARIAREVGQLLAAVGVSVNFAPCADVAVDPANPVIGTRSFGADPLLVSRHTAAWVAGQQATGVAACAKHFPGHGDTAADTHRTAALLRGDLDTLMAEAIPPFRAAIGAGVSAIMVGHLLAPAVDGLPATVSRRWLTEILRGTLRFDGVVVTDALEMAALADSYGIPGGAVRALAAGADLLCLGGDSMTAGELDGVRDAIVAAVRSGDLTEERLANAADRCTRLGVSAMRTAGAVAGSPDLPPVAVTGTPDRPPLTATGTPDLPPVAVTGTPDLPPVAVTGTPDRPAAGRSPAHYAFDRWDPELSAAAARRALEVAGPLPALHDPVLVLRCEATANIAVGAIPWGPAAALAGAVAEIVLRPGDILPGDALARAGTVLAVTRDRHRHRWMADLVRLVRERRPDAVMVEMGISGVGAADAPALASYGASRANGTAVADALAAVRDG